MIPFGNRPLVDASKHVVTTLIQCAFSRSESQLPAWPARSPGQLLLLLAAAASCYYPVRPDVFLLRTLRETAALRKGMLRVGYASECRFYAKKLLQPPCTNLVPIPNFMPRECANIASKTTNRSVSYDKCNRETLRKDIQIPCRI